MAKYKPGETVPQSGIYNELNIHGQRVTQVTCVKGENFPPTEASGWHYELYMAAKHKRAGG